MLLMLITCLTSLWQPTTSQQCDLELDQQDKVLLNHVIKLIENVNYGVCMMECSMHPKCHSFNTYLDTDHCELNNATHMSHPEDMKHRPHGNYILYPARPLYKCNATLCGVGETCQVNKDGASYKCVNVIKIYLRSEAGADPVKSSPLGTAFITVDGRELSHKRRGHNVASLYLNGTVHSTKNFDTYADSNAGNKIAAYINALPDYTIVLIAIQDTGHKYPVDATSALKSIGAVSPVVPTYYMSWCLIGYKGPPPLPSWVQQKTEDLKEGPSVIETTIEKV